MVAKNFNFLTSWRLVCTSSFSFNGRKLEHAGQSGHLIPAAKPSQAKEEDEEVIRVGNVDKLEELIGGF